LSSSFDIVVYIGVIKQVGDGDCKRCVRCESYIVRANDDEKRAGVHGVTFQFLLLATSFWDSCI